jgi:hypothetical protein
MTMTQARRLLGGRAMGLALIFLVGLTLLPLPARAAQVPACLVGEWRFTNFDALLQAALPAAPEGEITILSGEAIAIQRADGSYETTYRELTLGMQIAGMPITMSFDGWERGTMREQAPGSLVTQTTETALTIAVTMQGQTERSTITGPSGASVATGYECAGDRAAFIYTVLGADGAPAQVRVEQVRVN